MAKKKNIVILGGGFAGLYTYLNLRGFLRKNPELGQITIVSKRNYFLFTPLLHEVATGSVSQSNIVQPILQILNCKSERFLTAEALEVDVDRQIVKTSAGEVEYDFLVLALGSLTKNMNFEGDTIFTLKTLEDARKIKNRIIECFEKANEEQDANKQQELLTFAVLGGGATGVEVAAELSEFAGKTLPEAFPRLPKDYIKIYLIHSGGELLPDFDQNLRKKTLRLLSKKPNLEVLLGAKAVNIDSKGVVLSSGRKIASATAILAVGVEPTPIAIVSSVNKEINFVSDQYLRLKNFENIFILGDMAKIESPGQKVPQTAQAAVEQGKAVAKNIIASLQNRPLTRYIYKERGQLVSLGRWMAVAEIRGFSFFGHLAWWMWRTIYASKIIGWANRLRVVMDWTMDIFYPRDISKL